MIPLPAIWLLASFQATSLVERSESWYPMASQWLSCWIEYHMESWAIWRSGPQVYFQHKNHCQGETEFQCLPIKRLKRDLVCRSRLANKEFLHGKRRFSNVLVRFAKTAWITFFLGRSGYFVDKETTLLNNLSMHIDVARHMHPMYGIDPLQVWDV